MKEMGLAKHVSLSRPEEAMDAVKYMFRDAKTDTQPRRSQHIREVDSEDSVDIHGSLDRGGSNRQASFWQMVGTCLVRGQILYTNTCFGMFFGFSVQNHAESCGNYLKKYF